MTGDCCSEVVINTDLNELKQFMINNIYVFLVICILNDFRTPTTMTTTKTWWTTPRTRSTRSRSSKEKGKNISANANEDPLVTRELRVLKVSFTKKISDFVIFWEMNC